MNREQYAAELARILRELLAAGSRQDWDKMLELAKDIERLAVASRDGSSDENPG
ncbi:hypothetical protein ES703_96755 [subsurface metagenome]